jgi:hypothetical protein
MLNSKVIEIEEDKSLFLYEYGQEWQTVMRKKKKHHVKRLLEETLEEALNNQINVPGLNAAIDPVKWNESYNKVLTQHLNYLTSYTKSDIEQQIEKLKKSENKHDRVQNYVQFDCRKYANGKELDMMVINDYKFMINRLFGNDDFIHKLKKYYRSLGYNIGFSYREENGINKYTHLKVYFK